MCICGVFVCFYEERAHSSLLQMNVPYLSLPVLEHRAIDWLVVSQQKMNRQIFLQSFKLFIKHKWSLFTSSSFLKCRDLLLLSVLYVCKSEIFEFLTSAFKNISLDSGNSRWAFFTTFLTNQRIEIINYKSINMKIIIECSSTITIFTHMLWSWIDRWVPPTDVTLSRARNTDTKTLRQPAESWPIWTFISGKKLQIVSKEFLLRL